MPQIDYTVKAIRTSLIVTTSYVAGTVMADSGAFHPREYNQLILLWDVTLGSLTSAELKVEFSPDAGSTYFQETAESISGGTATDTLMEHTVTATGKYRLAVPIADGTIKISFKGTGTVTSSLVACTALFVKNYA